MKPDYSSREILKKELNLFDYMIRVINLTQSWLKGIVHIIYSHIVDIQVILWGSFSHLL